MALGGLASLGTGLLGNAGSLASGMANTATGIAGTAANTSMYLANVKAGEIAAIQMQRAVEDASSAIDADMIRAKLAKKGRDNAAQLV